MRLSRRVGLRCPVTDLYDLGDRPPLGVVPQRMHAYAVRQNRFGQPRDAWKREVIATPSLRDDEVLIYVMASGINFNNVWAALGTPLDVIAERQRLGEPEDFHAGGSDCSGIVWAVGRDVRNVSVGDEVIVHSGWWQADDPWVRSGRDPVLAESHARLGLSDQLRQLLPVRSGPPIACSWAGALTSSSPATSSSSGERPGRPGLGAAPSRRQAVPA